MDELLFRYLRGRTTDDEDRSVDAWRKRSADADRTLSEMGRLIEAGRAAELAIDPGTPPSVEQVILRARARSFRPQAPRRPRRIRFLSYGGWAAAAAAVGFALWSALADSAPPPLHGPSAPQEFLTASGETAMVRLEDGSVIRLGPGSRLATTVHASSPDESPSSFARQVTLNGEAFFAIATNEEQPFLVVTPAGTARALGTRFHLSAHADELAVVVVEGRVALAGPDQEIEVGEGRTTRLARGIPGPVTSAPPIEEVAGWMRGFLALQDTPLAAAMREIGERYGIEVEIADPALLDRTLTMWFSSKSLEEVMTVVCGVIDARCSIGEGVVRIRGRDEGGRLGVNSRLQNDN
ncbi:MAG: FecR domain-containing protein [Gemmatimonadetes bacterium]|nr:FecR domain-containing protein [Gemmatimonadota bacterium]MCY3943299.1 FecR domain-containing protein [Gemmatimonadota bacterium]